jgi:hypothetical protein
MSSGLDRMLEILKDKKDNELLSNNIDLMKAIAKTTKDSIPNCIFHGIIDFMEYDCRIRNQDYGHMEYNGHALIEKVIYLIRPVHKDIFYDMIILDGASTKESSIVLAERFCDELYNQTMSKELMIDILKNDKSEGLYKRWSADISVYKGMTSGDISLDYKNTKIMYERLRLHCHTFPSDDEDDESDE